MPKKRLIAMNKSKKNQHEFRKHTGTFTAFLAAEPVFVSQDRVKGGMLIIQSKK